MKPQPENKSEPNYGTRSFCDRTNYFKPLSIDELERQYKKISEYNRKLIFASFGVPEYLFEINPNDKL